MSPDLAEGLGVPAPPPLPDAPPEPADPYDARSAGLDPDEAAPAP
jgi:hypothetical protein